MPSHDRSSGHQVVTNGRVAFFAPLSSEEAGLVLVDQAGRHDSPLQPRRWGLVVFPLLPLRFDPIRAGSHREFAACRARNMASRVASGLMADRMA